MTFGKEEAYQYTLCMDLTANGFHFAVVDPRQKKIIYQDNHVPASFDREHLDRYLKENELFTYEFEHFVLSSGSPRNTLLPVDIFAYTKPKEAFKLNYPEPIDNLDYNRIPELGIVNIYELPLWIKTLFVIRFPRVKVVHRSTVFLRGIFDQPTFRPKVHLLVENEQFYMALTDRSKLVYFNRFDYKALTDLVYYVLFVLEQKEYEQDNLEVNLYGQPADWTELKTFKTFFSAPVNLAPTSEKSDAFLLAKQLLCV